MARLSTITALIIFKQHIEAMRTAVEEDGVNLIGYTPWGCIDLVSAGTGEMKNVTVLSM